MNTNHTLRGASIGALRSAPHHHTHMNRKLKPSSIAIVRSAGFGSCKGCGYVFGTRSPRGELFLQVNGGTSNYPRSYHFTCWSRAVADYEAGLDLHAVRSNGKGAK